MRDIQAGGIRMYKGSGKMESKVELRMERRHGFFLSFASPQYHLGGSSRRELICWRFSQELLSLPGNWIQCRHSHHILVSATESVLSMQGQEHVYAYQNVF